MRAFKGIRVVHTSRLHIFLGTLLFNNCRLHCREMGIKDVLFFTTSLVNNSVYKWLREGEGIPLDGLSAAYSKWLGKSVNPKSVIAGCKTWRSVFRVNSLLQRTFLVTAQKKPMVKVRGGNENEECFEELMTVLSMVRYSNIVLKRAMWDLQNQETPVSDTADGTTNAKTTEAIIADPTTNDTTTTESTTITSATKTTGNTTMTSATKTTANTTMTNTSTANTTITNATKAMPNTTLTNGTTTTANTASTPNITNATDLGSSTLSSSSLPCKSSCSSSSSSSSLESTSTSLFLSSSSSATGSESDNGDPQLSLPTKKRRRPEKFKNISRKMKRLNKPSTHSPHDCGSAILTKPNSSTAAPSAKPTTTGINLSDRSIDTVVQHDNSDETLRHIRSTQSTNESVPGPSTSIIGSQNYGRFICDVCHFSEFEGESEVVFCNSCKVCVHKVCYEITETINQAHPWQCRPCQAGVKPSCIFCPNLGGAMKPTRSGVKWVHLSCSFWIRQLNIRSIKKMNPITNPSQIIPLWQWSSRCSLCKRNVGACIECSEKRCRTAYHVTCAFKHNLKWIVLDETKRKDGDIIRERLLKSYCPSHFSWKYRNDGSKEDHMELELTTDKTAEKSARVSSSTPEREQVQRMSASGENKMLIYPRFENGREYLDGYNYQFKITTTLHEVIPARKSHALASHRNRIYVIGGNTNLRDDITETDEISSEITHVFNAGSATSTRVDMNEPRREFAACVCKHYLYAIGGYQGLTPISSAERLDLNSQCKYKPKPKRYKRSQWEYIRSMQMTRAGHDVAVLESRIYLIGGIGPIGDGNGSHLSDCSSVMVYHPYFDAWEWVTSLNEPRAHVKTAVMNDRIYAVGGDVLRTSDFGTTFDADIMIKSSGDEQEVRRKLSTVEVYCPERDTWTYCPQLNHSRSDGTVIVQNDLLYAIGGDSEVNPTMEVYDPRTGNWILNMLTDWPMNLAKDADLSSAIVIDI